MNAEVPSTGLDSSRALWLSLLAIAIAGAAGGAVFRLRPFSDPPGIVGVPLIEGYSEASERAALLAFAATCASVGFVARRLPLASFPTSKTWILAFVATAGLLSLIAGSRLGGAWALLLGVSTCALCGGACVRWRPISPLLRAAVISMMGALTLSVQPNLLIEIGWWRGAGILATLVLVETWLRRAKPLDAPEHLAMATRWLCVLALASVVLAPNLEIFWTALGAAAFAGTSFTRGRGLVAVLAGLAAALLLVSADMRTSDWVNPIRPLLCSLAGGATAWMWILMWSGSSLSRRVGDWRVGDVEIAAVFIAIVLALTAATRNPWAMGGIGVGWLLCRRTDHALSLPALVVPVLLWLAFLEISPGTLSLPADPFHDGQLISGVWEFDHGRTLFDECAPLRLFDFWIAWLAEHVRPGDLVSYRLAFAMADPLGPIGVFLVVLAATRNPRWSLLTAFLAGMLYPNDYRVGVCLVGVAIVLWLGSRSDRTRIVGLVLVSGVSAHFGFDVVTTIFAASLASIVVRPSPNTAESTMPAAARISREGVVFVVGFSALHTAVLAILQGPASAVAYWELFVNFSRYYPTFYGMPIQWSHAEVRVLLVPFGLTLGTWITVSVWAWKRFEPVQRQVAAVLAVASLVIAQRAMGRSDSGHLAALNYPTLVLAAVGLWQMSKMVFAPRFPYCRVIEEAWLSLVLCVAIASIPLHGPIASFRQWRQSAGNPVIHWPKPDPDIARHLNADDTVWEMQDALMPHTYRRHNPTRHVLAYCMGWPEEQLLARDALLAHPPAVIGWKSLGPNEISNILRYYPMADDLFDNYQPSSQGPFLMRTRSDKPWREWSAEYGTVFGGLVRMGNLAQDWADAGMADFAESTSLIPDPLLPATRAAMDVSHGARERVLWIGIREVRVLKSSLAGRHRRRIILRFAGPGDNGLESGDRVEFDVSLDREPNYYLVPVGCSPAWSWRGSIDRIVLDSGGEFEFELFEMRLLKMRLGDLVPR